MDALVGLLILVAVIWIVRAALHGGGEDGAGGGETGGRRSAAPGAQRSDSARPPLPTPLDERERRRQDRADEAFIDGVLFAHHFDPFDRFGADGAVAGDEAEIDLDEDRDEDWDDDWDDGPDEGWDDAFHDDAGDW